MKDEAKKLHVRLPSNNTVSVVGNVFDQSVAIVKNKRTLKKRKRQIVMIGT